MNNFFLVILFCVLAFTASADQLDGLDGLGTVLMCVVLASISFITLMFASIARFSKRNNKANNVLTIAGITLILSCFVAISTIGNGIDPGFLATCIGLTILSLLLIILNIRSRKNSND